MVKAQPIGLWLPKQARILEVGSCKIASKADVPRVPPSHKPQWIRIADPERTEIHLKDESRHALTWLAQSFGHERLRSLKQKPLLHCFAAADAMAEGEQGWLVSSAACGWVAEQWSMQDIRQVWPQLNKSAQPYIACFETLAQRALAMLAHALHHNSMWTFALPAASDNAPAEAGINKLWSTAEPIGLF